MIVIVLAFSGAPPPAGSDIDCYVRQLPGAEEKNVTLQKLDMMSAGWSRHILDPRAAMSFSHFERSDEPPPRGTRRRPALQ
jgi:hypothetical protein